MRFDRFAGVRSAAGFAVLLLFIPAVLFSLSLDDVTAKIDETNDVKAALLAVEIAKKQVELLEYPGNPSVAAQPGTRFTSTEGGPFGEQVDFYGSASFALPLGLSPAGSEKLAEAKDTLHLAQLNLESIRAKAFIKLYGLYQSVWLAWKELDVLDAELEAAESTYEIMRQKFEEGEEALTELSKAEEDLRKAEELRLQEKLNHRLAWLELAFEAGLHGEGFDLEENLQAGEELPRPPSLSAWAYDHHAQLAAQAIKVKQLSASVERLEKLDFSVNLRSFFNYGAHSAGLGFTFTAPELSGSYSFPIATVGGIDQAGSGTTSSTWNTGLTVGITFTGNRSDKLSAESLSLSLQSEIAAQDYLRRLIDLEIRSRYQQWLKAQDSLKQAQRSLERAIDNLDIVNTKVAIGSAQEYEKKAAAALLERARWNVVSATIEQEKAIMAAADAAAYLYEIEPRLRRSEL